MFNTCWRKLLKWARSIYTHLPSLKTINIFDYVNKKCPPAIPKVSHVTDISQDQLTDSKLLINQFIFVSRFYIIFDLHGYFSVTFYTISITVKKKSHLNKHSLLIANISYVSSLVQFMIPSFSGQNSSGTTFPFSNNLHIRYDLFKVS